MRRSWVRPAAIAAASLVAPSAAHQAKAEEVNMGLIEITNGKVVVGVLPPLGGRVVLLKRAGGENVLDSDPKHWKPPFPRPELDTPFQPWNGRIVWVGPQTGFWSQTDLRPDLKEAKAVWPPDPFNETGRFEVVERTPTKIRLKGGVSPVTGLSFEHEYEIVGERTVRMRTLATNGRTAPVSWDLWPNTRVRPEGHPYVPLEEPPRMDGPRPDEAEVGTYPHEVHDGWLTLPPGRMPEAPRKKLWAKAYVRPSRAFIACFVGKELLVIRAPLVPREKLHPEQAFVEIYRGSAEGDVVLELEMHGPYETLAPGGSTSFEQTFELADYDGPPDPAEHLSRLRRLLK